MLKTSAIILLFILGSIFLRIYHIDDVGLTQNETLTLCRINGVAAHMGEKLDIEVELPPVFKHGDVRKLKNWDRIVDATISDSGNAMAYNLILSGWTRIFGDTNTSMRMLTLIFGVLTVILGYYFCRQLFNERTANIAGVLLCLHPVLVEYGQLARTYVPATFFILLTTYSIYQVSVTKRHTWLHIPLYVISLNLSVLFHYVTFYIFISHILLVALFHSHRKALIQYAFMSVAVLGLFMIWMFNGGWEGKRPINIEKSMWQQQLPVNDNDPERIGTAKEIIYDLGMNGVRLFGNDLEPAVSGQLGFLLMLLLPAVIVFFVFRKVRKSEYFRPVMFVTFPILMYFVFAVTMAIRTGHSIPFDIRYAVFVIPFACLLLSFGFDRMIEHSKMSKYLSYALLVIVTLVMLAGFFPGLIRHEANSTGSFAYHDAVDFIEENASQTDTIVFQNVKDAVLTNFYMRKEAPWVQEIDPYSAIDQVVVRKSEKEIAHHFGDRQF